MATNPVLENSVTRKAEAEAKLQEALARIKTASDRHEAVISALSRVGVSEAEKRFAQAESKKVDRDMRDARRLLREAQAFVRKQ
jgi:division protein CdvB (Snf7/Vps24/ESCRT-III family)